MFCGLVRLTRMSPAVERFGGLRGMTDEKQSHLIGPGTFGLEAQFDDLSPCPYWCILLLACSP